MYAHTYMCIWDFGVMHVSMHWTKVCHWSQPQSDQEKDCSHLTGTETWVSAPIFGSSWRDLLIVWPWMNHWGQTLLQCFSSRQQGEKAVKGDTWEGQSQQGVTWKEGMINAPVEGSRVCGIICFVSGKITITFTLLLLVYGMNTYFWYSLYPRHI